MPTILTNGIQLPDKGSVDWYNSMQSNYNLIDTHLGNTDIHVTAEDKANWDSKQGSLSQAQLDAIAQVSTNTSDIATLQSGKANASHTHSSSDITNIGDYATKQYVDSSISGLVDNAPDALNTLNELSAALNDDSNFASTVTNALATKANSADLATVATSGSYNDLSNKPTINDSTITIQKNGSLVGTFTVNGSAKTIDIPVPTKTSDLTNDSNFVDTSNSAVASGITSAKVTSYDSHIADTDIHVTTADKTKWNNGVSQSYVLRYSSSSVTDNSTIAYSTLDNTDNVKSGDKVIDVDGKIFSVVSVDTTNQTVTVGSALIDLALDANVVHTSGDETKNGELTASKFISNYFRSNTGNIQIQSNGTNRSVSMFNGSSAGDGGGFWAYGKDSSNGSDCRMQIYNTAKSRYERVDLVGSQFLPTPSGELDCGSASNKYKSFNGLEPSALGMPDLNSGVDISSYITVVANANKESLYTPPANGWVCVRLSRTNGVLGVLLIQGDLAISGKNIEVESGVTTADATIPVIGGVQVSINSALADSVVSAKFFPCLGNV